MKRTKPGDPMTPKQRRVYRLILESYRDRGRAPTLRELADDAGFNSHVGPVAHLRALAARGVISYEKGATVRQIIVPAIREALAVAAAEIIKRHDEQRVAVQTHRKWAAEEVELFGTMDDVEIAARVGRSVGAVRVKRRNLKTSR